MVNTISSSFAAAAPGVMLHLRASPKVGAPTSTHSRVQRGSLAQEYGDACGERVVSRLRPGRLHVCKLKLQLQLTGAARDRTHASHRLIKRSHILGVVASRLKV